MITGGMHRHDGLKLARAYVVVQIMEGTRLDVTKVVAQGTQGPKSNDRRIYIISLLKTPHTV